MRFIRTQQDDNLTAIAQRLFCVEGGQPLYRARAKLLELNPGLPDRKKIPPNTFVLIPDKIDGRQAREGRTVDEAVEQDLLESVKENLGRLDTALAEQVKKEYARHKTAKANLAIRQVRNAARTNKELAERLKNLKVIQQERAKQTAELENFRKSALPRIEQDLAQLVNLAKTGLTD